MIAEGTSGHSILGVGELLWDCFGDVRRPGGAPANVAFHAAQLGARGDVCSRVGADDDGDALVAALDDSGVGTKLIQRDAFRPTGTVTVDDTEPDHPKYTIHEEVAWDYIEFDGALRAAAERASAICFGTLAQRSPPSRDAIHRLLSGAPDALILYDVNLRPPWYERATIERSLDRCAVVKLNEDEAKQVADLFDFGVSEAAVCGERLLSRFDIQLVCITRGPKGCLLVTDEARVEQRGHRVEVVDAVGAGDAFTAALMCGLLWKWPLAAVARFANEVGGLVASRKGAMPDLGVELQALRARFQG
ncbi:MAG: carbohydrate kinase [Phycisphaerae bacterium]|jgi:fructokinase